MAEGWDSELSQAARWLALAMASQEDGAVVNVHEHAAEAKRVFARLKDMGLSICVVSMFPKHETRF